MKLTNSDEVRIAEAKLREYVLNPDHRRNRGKARLFAALGYSRDNWQQLEADIREQHLTQDAQLVETDEHGERWEIVAPLRGPEGTATIVAGWIIPVGGGVPHFVTAYKE